MHSVPDALDPAAPGAPVSPRAAMEKIRDELAGLDPAGRAERCEAIVAALPTLLASTPTAEDWFEPLLDDPPLPLPFPTADTEMPAGDPELATRLCRLLLLALDAMAPEARIARLRAAAAATREVSLLCALVSTIAQERDASYLGAGAPALHQDLLERIGALVAGAEFWSQYLPGAMLWFWFVHGEEDRVYGFTRRAMDDPRGLAALLTIPLERTGSGPEQSEIIAARRWSRIIDFRTLEARAVALAMSAPSRLERRRARRFLDAFGDGKSDLFR